MKKIIIHGVAATMAVGALAAAPPASAEPDPDPDPAVTVVTISGLSPFSFQFPLLTRAPLYEPRGLSLGTLEVRGAKTARSIPPSNPTA